MPQVLLLQSQRKKYRLSTEVYFPILVALILSPEILSKWHSPRNTDLPRGENMTRGPLAGERIKNFAAHSAH